MTLAADTLAHRRALLAYEELASRAVARRAMQPLDAVFERLRQYEERLASGRPLTATQRRQAERDQRTLLRTIRRARTDARATLQQRLEGAVAAEQRVSVRNLTAALPEGRTARAPGIDVQTLLLNPTAGSPWTARFDASLIQTYQRIDAALLVAVDRGASMPNAAELVRRALGEETSTPARLTRLVRTEIQRVSNEAAQATYAANVDVIGAVRYLATLDSRVCPICRPLHRRTWPLDEDGTHSGPTIPRHPNCFPAGVVVSGPRAEAATKRWYSGPLVELETTDGRRLAVTPNHPMLTPRGWVAAGDLNEGDELVDAGDIDRLVGGRPDDKLTPARIEDVAAALVKAGSVSSAVVPVSAEDFHGDGLGGEVDIVWTDRLLVDRQYTALGEPVLQVDLQQRHAEASLLYRASVLDLARQRHWSASDCIVCGDGVAPVLLGRAAGHHHAVRRALAAYIDALSLEHVGDQTPRRPVGFGEGVDRLPIPVALQQLIERQVGGSLSRPRLSSTRRSSYSGHVYNLQTTQGWYVAEGIVTHNCRCFYAPVTRSLSEILAAA